MRHPATRRVEKRTGHAEREHTLDSLDKCRVSWGKITDIDGPSVSVETEPLLYINGKLALGKPTVKKLTRALESASDIDELKTGDLISIHWDVICERIIQENVQNLKKYTLRHLMLANQTI